MAARQEAVNARRELADAKARTKTDALAIKALRDKLKLQEGRTAEEKAERISMETTLSALIAKAEKAARDARDKLAIAEKELGEARIPTTVKPEDAPEYKKMKVRLAAAVSELKRQQETFHAANAERDRAKKALASLKSQHDASLGQIRRVYLAAAAPGKIGLAALQEAMKNRGLLKRCVALQRKAQAVVDKKLLARTEIVLTRLGLLDISDSVAVAAYRKQLADSDLLASLDKVLGPMASDAETQDWLFETRLILTGVNRAA